MKSFIILLLCVALMQTTIAQPLRAASSVIMEKIQQPALVKRFYELREKSFFWYDNNDESCKLRCKLVSILDSCLYLGMVKEKYHYKWLIQNTNDLFAYDDSLSRTSADKVYTDALISFCKDLYQGYNIDEAVSYDEISFKYEAADNRFILGGICAITSPIELEWLINFLQPVARNYFLLKAELRNRTDSNDAIKVKQLSSALNLIRWTKHFNLGKFVVVNPATGKLQYFVEDTVQLSMKVITGRTETPTPRFAAYCNAVVLYPYWNIPTSIALNELLPMIKRYPSYLDVRNLQVIDAKGRIIDPETLNWSSFSSKYFPYQIRQSTGCDNALGVIKFNLTDPFSVYMHDTNNKTAFLAGARFFSHGCVRLEQPVELATAFLPGRIDTAFLTECAKNQKPVSLKLNEPVPVFVVYITTEVDEKDRVKYYKDVYKLF
jgi:hypothetical protein